MQRRHGVPTSSFSTFQHPIHLFSSLVELLLLPLLMASSSSSPLPSPLLTLKGTSSRSPSLPSTLHLPSDQPTSLPTLSTHRRELLVSVASISTLLPFHKPSPSVAREVEVGAYLPPSPSDPSFVVFKASPTDTPALRAGTYKLLLLPLMCLQCLVVQSIGMIIRRD